MDLRNILTFFLIAAFALVFPAFPEGRAQAASDWPQRRGHNGSGVSTETGLPEHWGPNSAEIQWRTAIPGTARSSPIASAGRIFLTTAYPEQSSSRISDLFAMLAICSTLILLIYATYTRQEVFYRIGVPSYFKGPRAITELCAWLLFACVMACCLANDTERINKPYGLFRPIPILIPLLGVTVVFSRAPGARRLEFHKAQRGLVEWGRPLMPGLFLVLIAVLLWLAHAPSRYVYVAVSLGLAQPLVRLNPDQQKPGSPVTAEQSLLNYATLAFLTIACITWLDPSLFWSGSTDANIWIRAAVISSFGLVSAIAWAKPSSQIRLAGSVTLLLAAYLVFHYTPLSTSVKTTAVHEHFEVPYTTWKRVLAVTPGIIGAFWHAVVFFLSRGKGDVVSKRCLWIGGHLVAVAIMIFV